MTQLSISGITPAEDQVNNDAVQQFDRDGYFIARQLLSPPDVEFIKNAFMDLNSHGPVPGLSEIHRDGTAGFDVSDPLSFYPRMMHPHLHPELPVGEISMQYMLNPNLRPFLKCFMGDEPVAVQSMFYFKPPKARGQALHQDNFYLRVAPGTCMAAWMAIDDADPENGGMMVVPGSQNLAIACPEKSDASISFTTDYVPVPEGSSTVSCDLKAGDVLFFNGSLIHGSTPNTSESRFRRSLICHYVPLSSKELSEGYLTRLTFDHKAVNTIQPATGGGPCGVAQPFVLH